MPILSLLLAALCGAVEGSAPPTRVEEAELARVRQGVVDLVLQENAAASAPTFLEAASSGSELPTAPTDDAARPDAPGQGQPLSSADAERVTQTLVIARAVLAVSSQLDTVRVQERGDWLTALSLARNLRHLGFARRAVDRYRLALEADPHAAFTPHTVLELADAAVAVGDSALLVQQAQSIAARSDAASHVDAIARLLTARLAWAPGPDTVALWERLESLAGGSSPATTLALARARQANGEFSAALRGDRKALSADVFRSLCGHQHASGWQQDACWQQRLAEYLIGIRSRAVPTPARTANATAMGGGS